jgi:hypothetical protein
LLAGADELPPMRPLRILLAEDSVVNQKLAVALLAAPGARGDDRRQRQTRPWKPSAATRST